MQVISVFWILLNNNLYSPTNVHHNRTKNRLQATQHRPKRATAYPKGQYMDLVTHKKIMDYVIDHEEITIDRCVKLLKLGDNTRPDEYVCEIFRNMTHSGYLQMVRPGVYKLHNKIYLPQGIGL